MKKIIIIAFIMIVLNSACGPKSPSEGSIQTVIAQTDVAKPTKTFTAVPTNTSAPTNTNTPLPTNTPHPTSTPRPTNTPRPTATRTPKPTPIHLSGKGDSVVDIQKWSGPGLAKIAYTGGGNFAVWNYGPNGEPINLLVNTIGNYEGTLPLDFIDDEKTERFEITGNGQWEIQILPLEEGSTSALTDYVFRNQCVTGVNLLTQKRNQSCHSLRLFVTSP